ncbi:TetR family transcriptional regulator [Microbacterium sp. NPDC056044]|uniref:TetR family transcriptional regulator n=1 Tax=Microbacterium sp. NPDC056044 TaxID=3345690 RepID=UPI0035E063A7
MTERPLTLTERRKAETQIVVARAAARLFAERGSQDVTTEEVAEAGGVAVRTFYRYFRSKADAVAPLLAVGADEWRARISGMPADLPVRDALERAIRETLSPPARDESLGLVRGVLRAAGDDPDLAAVWYRVNGESERMLFPLLRERDTDAADLSLRILAAAATSAIRIAFEVWAATDEPDAPHDDALRIFRALSAHAPDAV